MHRNGPNSQEKHDVSMQKIVENLQLEFENFPEISRALF